MLWTFKGSKALSCEPSLNVSRAPHPHSTSPQQIPPEVAKNFYVYSTSWIAPPLEPDVTSPQIPVLIAQIGVTKVRGRSRTQSDEDGGDPMPTDHLLCPNQFVGCVICTGSSIPLKTSGGLEKDNDFQLLGLLTFPAQSLSSPVIISQPCETGGTNIVLPIL